MIQWEGLNDLLGQWLNFELFGITYLVFFRVQSEMKYPESPKTKLCPMVVGVLDSLDRPKDNSLFGLGLPGNIEGG